MELEDLKQTWKETTIKKNKILEITEIIEPKVEIIFQPA